MSRTTLLVSLGLLLGGCARSSAPTAPQAQIKKDLPVICRLVSRTQTLTISAGTNGAVYSVQNAAGQTLLANASREELRLRHPDLAHQLETGIADSSAIAIKE